MPPVGSFPQRRTTMTPTTSHPDSNPRRAHFLIAIGCAFALLLSASSAEEKSSAATAVSAPPSTNVQSLFDGKSLTGWSVTDFAGRGAVKVDAGRIVLETGVMTGVTWTNDLPKMNYEISLEAMRVDGSDFFCALTFPVNADPCSFIVGGWGGGVVGLSSVDSEDAAHNETTSYMNFENGKWFKIRVRVTPTRIEAWIDKDRAVNLETKGKTLSIRPEVELSKPLGIASWSTTAALRNIQLLRLPNSAPSGLPAKP